MPTILLLFPVAMKIRLSSIRRFVKEKGTGAEMCPAIVSGIVTGDVPVSYWPILSLSLVTVPEVFTKVNSAQSPLFWIANASDTIPCNKSTLYF